MNTNTDTVIDLSVATDSIPVVEPKYRVIIETQDRWLGVFSSDMPRSSYEQMLESEKTRDLNLHVIGEYNADDQEQIAKINEMETAWIQQFVVNCTRNLRSGEWVYPEERQTSEHRSVYALLIFGGEQYYVRCKVGVYRALREAIADFYFENSISDVTERENKLKENDESPFFVMMNLRANGVYIRLCRDDEMTTQHQIDLFKIMGKISAINPDFINIIMKFSQYLIKYTSYTISTDTSVNPFTGTRWTPEFDVPNNTPIDSNDDCNDDHNDDECNDSECNDSDCSDDHNDECNDDINNDDDIIDINDDDDINDNDGITSESSDESNSEFDEIENIINRGYQEPTTSVVRLRKGQYAVKTTITDNENDNYDEETNSCDGTTTLLVSVAAITFIVFVSVIEQLLD